MVFNSSQPTPLPNRLTMRGIVSVVLLVADSDYRSWGKWYTTIKTMSLISAACPVFIGRTEFLLAGRGIFPALNTRKAKPFENSEMAGASRVSPLCNPGSLSAPWTAQPARCLVPQLYTPLEAWLLERHLPMRVGMEASAAV